MSWWAVQQCTLHLVAGIGSSTLPMTLQGKKHYLYIYLFIPAMVIDHSYPVINLRTHINNLMVSFYNIMVWDCFISLKEHRKGVFSRGCCLTRPSPSVHAAFSSERPGKLCADGLWPAVIVSVCIRDQKMHPALCTTMQSNQIINKMEP